MTNLIKKVIKGEWMRLTKRAEYALRAMLELAFQPEEKYILSKEISEKQSIPLKFLAHIFLDLSRGGLIQTNRGIGGGIKITKPPSQINLKEIIELIEGPIALNDCLTTPSQCQRDKFCSLYDVWAEAQKKFLEVLEQTTLEDLVTKGSKKSQSLSGKRKL